RGEALGPLPLVAAQQTAADMLGAAAVGGAAARGGDVDAVRVGDPPVAGATDLRGVALGGPRLEPLHLAAVARPQPAGHARSPLPAVRRRARRCRCSPESGGASASVRSMKSSMRA